MNCLLSFHGACNQCMHNTPHHPTLIIVQLCLLFAAAKETQDRKCGSKKIKHVWSSWDQFKIKCIYQCGWSLWEEAPSVFPSSPHQTPPRPLPSSSSPLQSLYSSVSDEDTSDSSTKPPLTKQSPCCYQTMIRSVASANIQTNSSTLQCFADSSLSRRSLIGLVSMVTVQS